MFNVYKINVLTTWFSSPNETAFLYPLLIHKFELKEAGFVINFYDKVNDQLTDCSIIIICSKYYSTHWDSKNTNKTINEIYNLKKNGAKVIYADVSDSAGVVHMRMLDVVDLYIKNQLYIDKKNYLKPLYGYRLYSHYFHKKFNIKDKYPAFSEVVLDKNLLDKLHLGWNSGLGHYGKYGYLCQSLYNSIGLKWYLPYPKIYKQNIKNRSHDIQTRFNTQYSRESVSCMRKLTLKKLNISYDNGSKLNRFQYFKELKKTKVILSPFGLGEITLKDFETFLTGGLLLKPRMDHMVTWPNLYKENENVMFYNWDLTDLEDKIQYCLGNYDEINEIALDGQNNYNKFIDKKTSSDEFIKHFNTVIQKLY